MSLLAATPFFLGPDAINGNQVAFGVSFTTPSSTGIYLATFTPVPEPSALALATVAGLGLVRRWHRFGCHGRPGRVRLPRTAGTAVARRAP